MTMKEWLTAKEIAAESLPDVGATERAVQMMAEREGWNLDTHHARKRQGRGGGMEYSLGLLPLTARVAYQQKHLRIGIVDLPPAANDTLIQAGQALTAKASLERDARLAIVKHFERFASGVGVRQMSALQLFVDRYNHRVIHVDGWILEIVPAITKPSLQRWRTKAKSGSSLAVDRGVARRGKGVLDIANGGAVRATMLALLADNPHFSAEHIRDVVQSEYGQTLRVPSKGAEKAVALPPVRTFQHVLKVLRSTENVTLIRVQNPDLFRSTLAPRGVGTLGHLTEPNQLWQIDASPVDALCTDGRHAIYVCEDIVSRRMILLMSKTARASAVALMIRKAILAWGVPQKIKTDNGSDFVARDTKRLFGSLGIEVELSEKYTPQQKGHVERAIGDFQHDCATMLPGFIGHSVADRKAIESRKSFANRLGTSENEAFSVSLTGEQMQAQVDRWTLTREHEAHGGLKGETPFARAAKSLVAINRVEERALDLLLMTVASGGTRRTTAKGIRVDGYHYMTTGILPGTEVLVRMDGADLGLVYAFTPDGAQYLGAGLCPELSGIDPAEAARALKAAQNEITSRGAAAIRAEIRRLKKGGDYHERILAVRESRIPNVIALPKRTEVHTTPQITAALDAMDAAADRYAPPSTDVEMSAAQRRLIDEMEAEEIAETAARHEATLARHEAAIETRRTAHLPETVVALPETAKDRYRRHHAVRLRMEAGEAVDPKDAVLLGRYETTSEFKGQKALHDDFGDAFLAK